MTSDDMAARLEAIEELVRVIAKVSVAPILREELKDERMARLYGLTGQVTADVARRKLSCGKATVVNAWQRWESMGLIKKNGKRYERIF